MDRTRTATCVALALTLLACEEDPTTLFRFAVPTEVAVNPADFLGDTSCSSNEGAMRSYVMTLTAFEDEQDRTPFIVGSTQPTPCSLVAGFREVIVIGQPHIAEVDGYDLPVELLRPFGGSSSASRQMRHVETGEVVTPRWTTTCGRGPADGAVATGARRVFVRPCEPLVDSAPTPTQIGVNPVDVLGEAACDRAPTFDLAPESGNLPAITEVACDAEPIRFDVAPGASYELYATTTIMEVPHGTICTATAVPGVTVFVRCNPISASGRANVMLANVMTGADEPLCPASGNFDIVQDDVPLNDVPLPCDSPAQIGPLAAGLELFDVVVRDAAGNDTGRGSCGAEIAPGKTTTALCVSSD